VALSAERNAVPLPLPSALNALRKSPSYFLTARIREVHMKRANRRALPCESHSDGTIRGVLELRKIGGRMRKHKM